MQGLSLWRITGKNVEQFLQGQLTADVRISGSGFCYCDKKGKVCCIGWLIHVKDEYWLCLEDENANAMFSAWQPFAQFSQIKQEQQTEFYPIFKNKTLIDITTKASDIAWPEYALTQEIPLITEQTRWLYTPHMLAATSWAVSFTKGCFLGQEIIARTEHLGQVKRSLKTFIKPQALTADTIYNSSVTNQTDLDLGKALYVGSELIQAIVTKNNEYFIAGIPLEPWVS